MGSGTKIGIIAGSSLPVGDLATDARSQVHEVEGADGSPTSVEVHVAGDLVVLPRHGPGGDVPAHLVDHHAAIRALLAAGCDRALAMCSVGSLRADLAVGTVVAPDDFLAFGAHPTFFEDRRGHRVVAIDAAWRRRVVDAWTAAAPIPPVDGGTYAQTVGPRFESPAEVRVLAAHADVVGMTMAAELVLAAEAGLAYAALCSVDNMANGVGGELLTREGFTSGTAAAGPGLATTLAAALDHLGATR